MKYVAFLIALLSLHSATAIAKSQCDNIIFDTLTTWRQWANEPQHNHTEKSVTPYEQALKRGRGLVLIPNKNGAAVQDLDPLSANVKLLIDSKVVARVDNSRLKAGYNSQSQMSEVFLPPEVVAKLKEAAPNIEAAQFEVTYYKRQDPQFVDHLKLSGIVQHYPSSNGRNAQVVYAGDKPTAIIVPEPNRANYKAILFSDDCRIKSIVYKNGADYKAGPTKELCQALARGKKSTDTRMKKDCDIYSKWLVLKADRTKISGEAEAGS